MARFTEDMLPDNIIIRYKHHSQRNRLESTSCYLINRETDDVVTVAHATVSPNEKCPSKKVGRNISRGRAIKKYVEYHTWTEAEDVS